MDILNNPNSKFYDPSVTVSDIEVWLHTSYGTARRRLAQMKRDLGIPKYKKPTKSAAMRYFQIAN